MVAADEPTAPHVLVAPRRTFTIARVSVVKHSLVTVQSYYRAEPAISGPSCYAADVATFNPTIFRGERRRARPVAKVSAV